MNYSVNLSGNLSGNSPANSPTNSEWISDRTQALQPYLVTKAERGIIGRSRYVLRLRQDIKNASGDLKPVVILGEAGLDKDNIAALIHFNSGFRREAIAIINCSLIQASGAELFGRVDGNLGILTWIRQGTLVLNNIQELPKEVMPKIKELLEQGTFKPVGSPESSPTCLCEARIILVSEKHEPTYALCAKHLIKVPALRVRKSDIKPYAEYYVSLLCRDRGLPKPKITDQALRSLQSYDFPENLKELQSMVSRAIAQSLGANTLTESVFWSNKSKRKQFRKTSINAESKKYGYDKARQ